MPLMAIAKVEPKRAGTERLRPMRSAPRSGLIGRLFALAAAAGCCGGCSLLFHADAYECTTTPDCTNRGGAFSNTICQAGICVSPQDAAVSKDAGRDREKSEGDVGGADAGDGGPPCSSYTDCANWLQAQSLDYETACDVDRGRCVQLTSEQCPYAIGDYKETESIPPIFVGAFSIFPSGDPTSTPSYENYALAIKDFQSAGGIPVGGKQRMPVAVLCNAQGTAKDIGTSMSFLANSVHVSSLVAALDATTLAEQYGNYGYNTPANLFFVNPFGSDSTLNNASKGQLFDMLGDPSGLVDAYAAILPRIESYVRHNPPWLLDSTTQLRVAAVVGSALVLDNLSSDVEQSSSFTWNAGQSVASGGPTSTFLQVPISISTLNGQLLTALSDNEWQALVAKLLAFKPHVIVSFGSDEFVHLLQQLEVEWTPGDAGQGPLPFYLLSPYNADSALLQDWIGTPSTSAAALSRISRVVGIEYADPSSSSPPGSVLAQYDQEFLGAYPTGSDQEGNYYDAMYFAVDALVGAGKKPPLNGTEAASGMVQLVLGSGAPCNMGPAGMDCVFNALQTTTQGVNLLGTLGPPVFNVTTGARTSPGDVYCLMPNSGGDAGAADTGADAGSTTAVYTYDVLRLENDNNPDAGWAEKFPCYSGF